MPDPHWTAGIHHDGCDLYLSSTSPALGDVVRVRVRTPQGAPIEQVLLRTEPDGESTETPMEKTVEGTAFALWEAPFPVTMPKNPYGFVIETRDEGIYHYTAMGVSRVRWPILFDFALLADFAEPTWVKEAVFYQIFPDRFSNGDPSLDIPTGEFTRPGGYASQTLPWDHPVRPYHESRSLDFYGGDLPGIIARLDYLQELGITALYLNPIFTSSSSHRYNTEDFFNVDPHLGGNDALVDLREALHARGMRLMLDVTPNHSGDKHAWFTAAQADPDSPSASYYTFYERPDDYACWLGVRSLPKLNYASDALRDVMYRSPESILQHWMKPPYRIDGWRLDVFNMTGRQGKLQVQAEVAREMRAVVKNLNPDIYFMGESWFDASGALQGDQLDAVMNYLGFSIPLWSWLSEDHFDASDFAAQAQRFLAAIPWQVAALQFNLLGSHDTPRILHIADDRPELAQVAAALLLTYPGVPSIYYGDEVGLTGADEHEARAPMPWDQSQWNTGMHSWYKRLIRLRRESHALKYGGYQLLFAEGDVFAFQRASTQQRLVIAAYAGAETAAKISIPIAHAGLADGTTLRDLLTERAAVIKDARLTLHNAEPGSVFILDDSSWAHTQ